MTKYVALILFMLVVPVANASECAVEVDTAIAKFLDDGAVPASVICERNTINATLSIRAFFLCPNGAQYPLAASVYKVQGESSCGVSWLDCLRGDLHGVTEPGPVTGHSAAEDMSAVRNACKDLM